MANPNPQAATGRASNGWILTNSVIALLLGSAVTVLVHELAHWLVGALLGPRSYLFAFWVTQVPALTGGNAATAALAGPVVSLIVGTAMQILQPFRFRGDFAHLLWIWVACTSLMAPAVHLAISPLAGDIANAIEALGWPAWVSWAASALGILAVIGVAREWAIHSVRLCGHDASRLRIFSWYPWLISIPVAVGLALAMLAVTRAPITPAEQAVIVLTGLALTVFAPLSLAFTRRCDELEEPLAITPVPWLGIAGYVGLVAFNLAISGGITLP